MDLRAVCFVRAMFDFQSRRVVDVACDEVALTCNVRDAHAEASSRLFILLTGGSKQNIKNSSAYFVLSFGATADI